MECGFSFTFLSENDFDRMLPEILEKIPRKITCVDYHEGDRTIVFYFNSKTERKKYLDEEQNPQLFYLHDEFIPISFEPENSFSFGFVPENLFSSVNKVYLL